MDLLFTLFLHCTQFFSHQYLYDLQRKTMGNELKLESAKKSWLLSQEKNRLNFVNKKTVCVLRGELKRSRRSL
jgi:hypothetical protein